MIKNAWGQILTKMCICTFDFMLSIHWRLWQIVQYWLAHADLTRGLVLIVVSSEGMSKVNDICASEVAILTLPQYCFEVNCLLIFLFFFLSLKYIMGLEIVRYALFYAVMISLQ